VRKAFNKNVTNLKLIHKCLDFYKCKTGSLNQLIKSKQFA